MSRFQSFWRPVACLLLVASVSSCALRDSPVAVWRGRTPAPHIHRSADPIRICSFNIKWLGHFKRSPEAQKQLADAVADSDIVVVLESVATLDDEDVATMVGEMNRRGFEVMQTPQRTGKRLSGPTSAEYQIVFYRGDRVELRKDRSEFLEDPQAGVVSGHFDRVPYAYDFKVLGAGHSDFVLIGCHLVAFREGSKQGEAELAAELQHIDQYVARREARDKERDYIILGDCNVPNRAVALRVVPTGWKSMNLELDTTASPATTHPYDQVMYRPRFTQEVVPEDFRVLDLSKLVGLAHDRAFDQTFSDHDPIQFVWNTEAEDDD